MKTETYRIGIGGIAIESSTFSPHLNTTEDFTVLRGAALLRRYPFLPAGRFRDREDVAWLPCLHARAIPGGPISAATYRALKGELLDRVRAALPLDGRPSLTNCVEGSDDADFPDEIAPHPEDYVFLKRRPSAFYGTGVAALLRMLRRDTLLIGGGGSNRGVETSVREAFNMDLMVVVVREVCYGGSREAHEWSLNVAMKMFARVRTLEQTLAMLGAAGRA